MKKFLVLTMCIGMIGSMTACGNDNGTTDGADQDRTTQENLTSWIKAGVFCVGMGSKLFPGDKVAAEDWTYVTEKCKEALAYIAEARK